MDTDIIRLLFMGFYEMAGKGPSQPFEPFFLEFCIGVASHTKTAFEGTIYLGHHGHRVSTWDGEFSSTDRTLQLGWSNKWVEDANGSWVGTCLGLNGDIVERNTYGTLWIVDPTTRTPRFIRNCSEELSSLALVIAGS